MIRGKEAVLKWSFEANLLDLTGDMQLLRGGEGGREGRSGEHAPVGSMVESQGSRLCLH